MHSNQRRKFIQLNITLFLAMLVVLFMAFPATAQETLPVPESIQGRLSTSGAGLSEEYAISGRMIRLQGRFQQMESARVNENGDIVIEPFRPENIDSPVPLQDHQSRKGPSPQLGSSR